MVLEGFFCWFRGSDVFFSQSSCLGVTSELVVGVIVGVRLTL